MLVQKLFGGTLGINRIDFALNKADDGKYALSATALLDDDHKIAKSIVLDTDQINIAIKRSTKCINDIANDLVPGLQITEINVAEKLLDSYLTLSKDSPDDMPLPDKLKDLFKNPPSESRGPQQGWAKARSSEDIFMEVKAVADDIQNSLNHLFYIVSQLLRERG